MYTKVSIAITSLAAVASAAPSKLVARFGDSYTFYQGDGSANAGWPSEDSWGSFSDLWNANYPLLQQSCGWNGWGADNSADEINNINGAINQVSGETGVDARFILAIVMQESKGCVRVPTTNNGVVNPGLMQSHNGSGSCVGVNPCPYDTILQMIRDGTAGTSDGAGIQGTVDQASGAIGGGSRAFYAGARLYNSGSVDYNNLNNGLGSTGCYSTDVANRLTGWTLASSQCNA